MNYILIRIWLPSTSQNIINCILCIVHTRPSDQSVINKISLNLAARSVSGTEIKETHALLANVLYNVRFYCLLYTI